MIRRVLKKKSKSDKLDELIKKYNIPSDFLKLNRRSVARAVAVGIFVALIPMPFQMLLVLFLMPIFRFNAAIGLVMVWLSNPLTMPFMYYIEYYTGNFLLGYDGMHDIELTLAWFQDNFDDIIIPLYTGTLFYGVILAPLSYFLINYLWIKSVQRERNGKI